MDKKERMFMKDMNKKLFKIKVDKFLKSKFVIKLKCFFKGHDYGPIRKTNYREHNNFIVNDRIQICNRCKHRLELEQNVKKRVK